MQRTRRAYVKALYKNKALTKDITNLIKNVSFSEKIDGKSDDISFSFANRNNDFIYQIFLPERGDILVPTFVFENWFEDGDIYEIALGELQVDEVELEKSVSTEQIHIKAVPTMINSNVAGQKKTRAWQNTNLQNVAKDIAKDQQIDLVYKAKDIALANVEQKQESDLVFLSKLCTKNGCRLKIADNKIIILESVGFDKKNALVLHLDNISQYRVCVQSQDVYRGVSLKYHDPLKEDPIHYEYIPDNAPKVGKILEINEKVENLAQAEQIAKARLREKNAKQIEVDVTLFPNPLIRAGTNITFADFPYQETNFTVKEINFSFSENALSQSAKLTQCLQY